MMEAVLQTGSTFLYNRFKVRVVAITPKAIVVRKVNHPDSHTLHIPYSQLPKRLRP